MFAELKLVQLKENAKKLGIEGCESMKSKAEVISAIEKFMASPKSPAEKQDLEKKPVEVSGKKSQDKEIKLKDDLNSHPKFAKFKQGDK